MFAQLTFSKDVLDFPVIYVTTFWETAYQGLEWLKCFEK